jgi:hypothetical protein
MLKVKSDDWREGLICLGVKLLRVVSIKGKRE